MSPRGVRPKLAAGHARKGSALAGAAVAGAFGVVLAACGSTPEPPACPPVSVLGEAATLTRFAPGRGSDLLDVDFRAEIADLRSGCVYAKEEGAADKIIVGAAPTIIVARGPANETRKAELQYFVSVIDSSRTVLNKQLFPVRIAFAGNNARVETVQDDPPVSIDLPRAANGETGERYEILFGLQMSEGELRYNRQRSALP